MDVVSKYGQAYRCSLPVFEDEKQTNNEGKTRENEMRSSESEGMSTSDVIRQLLSPMKGACLTKVTPQDFNTSVRSKISQKLTFVVLRINKCVTCGVPVVGAPKA